MKIAKRPWERRLTIGVVISLAVIVLVSAGISLWAELCANIHRDELQFWSLGISAGALVLVCAIFLWRTYSHPLLLSLLSLVIAVALFIAAVCFIVTEFCCSVELPNYESQYAEWASTDPTPDTDITYSDRLKMGSSPDRYICAQTDSSRLADVVYFICGGACLVCSILLFVYSCIWLPRFFTPFQEKQNQKADIRKREKAFAQIEKFHEYKEKGIMTEEEYQENRQRVLESLN